LKAIKLQPSGIEDEQRQMDFLTFKNLTIERLGRNKATFVNGAMRQTDPFLISVP
jgi:hypothetical protein